MRELAGMREDEQFCNQRDVIFLPVSSKIYFPVLVISVGVIQLMSPSQNLGFVVSGVPQETTSTRAHRLTDFHQFGIFLCVVLVGILFSFIIYSWYFFAHFVHDSFLGFYKFNYFIEHCFVFTIDFSWISFYDIKKYFLEASNIS